MIKKVALFVWVLPLLLLLLGPALLQAQAGLEILDESVEANFPAGLSFSLSARSGVDIADIRLHYFVERDSFARVTSEAYLEFVPDTDVTVQWTWNMRRTGGLPPGSSVEYWWTVKDVNGGTLETDPVKVKFADNRYSWESLTEGDVTINWYQGRQSFTADIMSTAQEALLRLAEDSGAYLKKPVEIYVYANSRDLQGAMIFPQEWSGGVAYTSYGIIAIGIPPQNLAWGRRAVAHELTHLVVYQMTANPYSGLPTWLEEGLATYNEGELDATSRAYLEKAIAENTLISARSLSSPFSAYAEQSYLSYAQSYSLVEFLLSNYGQDKMLQLLDTFRQGNSYDGALEAVYGFDMDGLNSLWRDHVSQQYQKAGSVSG